MSGPIQSPTLEPAQSAYVAAMAASQHLTLTSQTRTPQADYSPLFAAFLVLLYLYVGVESLVSLFRST